MAFRFIYVLILSLYTYSSFAQTKQIKFTEIKGTASVTLGKINAFAQDSNGFIWMSDQTNRCIVRYDGSQLKRYGFDPETKFSLGGYYPETLYPDSNGTLWVGYYGQGFDKFNTYTNEVTHWQHDPNDPNSISNNYVTSIIKDSEGKIWIGHYGGVSVLNEETGDFTHFQHDTDNPNSLSHNQTRVIYEDREGTIWIGCGFPWSTGDHGGLNRFNRETNDFTRFMHDPYDPQSLAHNKVRAIFEDSRGTFWVGSLGKGGLHTMDRTTGKFSRHTYNPKKPNALSRSPILNPYDHITFITEDSENQIWIGTEGNGLVRFDPESGQTRHFGSNSTEPNDFFDNSGWAILPLDQGLLYIVTQQANVYQVDLNNFQIPHHKEFGQVDAFLHSSDDKMWFGSGLNGLFARDMQSGRTIHYKADPSNPNSLGNNTIQYLFEDSKRNIWVSTNSGLSRIDPTRNKFRTFYNDLHDSLSLVSNDVSEIIEDNNGHLWIGSNLGGLIKMNPETEEFHQIPWNPLNTLTNHPGNVMELLREDDNHLLLGTASNDGMIRYQMSKGEAVNFVPGLNIFEIIKDHAGDIWVSTSNGLYTMNEEDVLVPFKKHQLSRALAGFVRSVVEDGNQNLWVGTTQGLVQINPERNKIVLFDQSQGLDADNQAHLYVGYKDRNGRLYFTSNDGYYSFIPSLFEQIEDPSELKFTSLLIGNEAIDFNSSEVLQTHISQSTSISLAHDENTFGIEFSRIDFRNIGETQIQYQLENYDITWRDAYIGERLSYFQVPPGTYNLKLRSLNTTNGEWAEKSIQVNIAKPWWQESWAYLIYAVLLGLAVWKIHSYQKERTIRQERERIKDRELAQAKEIEKAYSELKATQTQLVHAEKMASLGELTAGIAHEIKNPLNFVNNFAEVNSELLAELKEEIEAGNYDEVKDIAKDLEQNELKIMHHGKRADSIVKGMLMHSRKSTDEKIPTDINALADEYLRLAYHGLRAKDKTFNATMKTEFDPSLTAVEVNPQDFGRVLLNLITNAFHACTDKKKQSSDNNYMPEVSIETKSSEHDIQITIADNGNGIPNKIKAKIFQPFFTTKASGEGTGLGLSISYDIITKGHNGILSVDSKEGEGTTFTIKLKK